MMSHWITNELCALTKENLDLLIDFKIPGIIVKNFLPKAFCQEVDRRLCETSFGNYDHLKEIPVHHLGVCHNQWCRDEKSVYFGMIDEAQKQIDDIYQALNIDPVQEVISALSNEGGYPAEVFEEEGFGKYFAGAFRSFKGHGRLHVDHAPTHIEKPWAVTEISKQLTWNIYYSVHNGGGELVIYDTIHTPENEPMKVSNDYYFPYEVLENEVCVRVQPEIGDLILFNTQNFHEILGQPEATRISQTSFIGLRNDGSLGLWS